MTDWPTRTVQEICSRVTSGGTPSRKKPEFYEPGQHPWVKSKELVDRPLRSTEELISDAGLSGSSAKFIAPKTTLMAMYGANVGQLGWLEISATVNQAICAMETDPDETEGRWLFYALMHHRPSLVAKAHGAAQQNLSQALIREYAIPVPPLELQRRIAAMLAAYDELIENNLRRIDILEEMAQAVYREWFVNFRFPGHENVPLVESSLGPIPDGWELSDLGASARWLSGGTPKTSEPSYWGGVVPWITSGSLTSFLLDRSDRTLTEQGVEAGSRLVPRDTLLFVVRGMSLATEFRHGIAEIPLAFGQDCKALIAQPPVHPLYLAHNVSARASEIQGMVEYAAHGTGKLSTDRLKALPVLHPPRFVQQAFVDLVAPMRRLMANLRGQVDNLRSTRDLLLPKLVSGAIDVSELDLKTEWLVS